MSCVPQATRSVELQVRMSASEGDLWLPIFSNLWNTPFSTVVCLERAASFLPAYPGKVTLEYPHGLMAARASSAIFQFVLGEPMAVMAPRRKASVGRGQVPGKGRPNQKPTSRLPGALFCPESVSHSVVSNSF